MHLSNKSDEELAELKKAHRDTISEIEAEERLRELYKEEQKNKSLVKDWTKLVNLSYFEGYHAGVNWEKDYIPCGPMIWDPHRLK